MSIQNEGRDCINVPVSGQQQHFRPFFDSRFTGHLLDFRLSKLNKKQNRVVDNIGGIVDVFSKEEV